MIDPNELTWKELRDLSVSLLKDVENLRAENARLRQRSSEYLSNWVAAQDLAYNRMVMSALGEEDK